MQLGQLPAGKLRLMTGNPAAEISRLACQSLGMSEQALRLIKGLLRLLKPLLHEQEGPGIVEKTLASFLVRGSPGAVDQLDLGAGELVAYDLLGQAHAGSMVLTGQGHQDSHRRLDGNLTTADRILDRQRQLAYQAQSTAHPGDGAAKALRQLLLAPAEAMLKL